MSELKSNSIESRESPKSEESGNGRIIHSPRTNDGGHSGPYRRNDWRPNIEYFSSLSADGRFLICKTVITAIKPVGYFEKILSGKAQKPVPPKDQAQAKPPEKGDE